MQVIFWSILDVGLQPATVSLALN